jgi:hypothetical protein
LPCTNELALTTSEQLLYQTEKEVERGLIGGHVRQSNNRHQVANNGHLIKEESSGDSRGERAKVSTVKEESSGDSRGERAKVSTVKEESSGYSRGERAKVSTVKEEYSGDSRGERAKVSTEHNSTDPKINKQSKLKSEEVW